MNLIEMVNAAGVVGAGGAGLPDPCEAEYKRRIFYCECR